jgi:putative oxidoreductase
MAVGLLILRGVVGALVAGHGAQKLFGLFGGDGIEGTAGFMESLRYRNGRVAAIAAGVAETVGGLLLILGFLTPLAAAGVIGVVAVAFVTNHRDAGFFVFHRPTEGWEYLMVLAAACVAIGPIGPGEWSLDDAFGILDDLDGWTGFLLTALVGFGGAAAFLAAFYRPPKKEPAAS